MTKPFKILTLVLIVLCVSAPAIAALPEELPRFEFSLDIVGTAHFEDIDHLKRGIMRAEGAQGVHVTRSSREFTRIKGTFQGKREHFERDLAGLAQDRFLVKINETAGGTVVVTITKLGRLVP